MSSIPPERVREKLKKQKQEKKVSQKFGGFGKNAYLCNVKKKQTTEQLKV